MGLHPFPKRPTQKGAGMSKSNHHRWTKRELELEIADNGRWEEFHQKRGDYDMYDYHKERRLKLMRELDQLRREAKAVMSALHDQLHENPADNYELLLSEHEHDVYEGRLATLLTVHEIVHILYLVEDKCSPLPKSGS